MCMCVCMCMYVCKCEDSAAPDEHPRMDKGGLRVWAPDPWACGWAFFRGGGGGHRVVS